MSGVVNVGGGECLGGECRTILVNLAILADLVILVKLVILLILVTLVILVNRKEEN